MRWRGVQVVAVAAVATCADAVTLKRSLRAQAQLNSSRSASSEAADDAGDDSAWQVCADEGQPIGQAGRTRFGWAMSWVESTLPSGASCSISSFGSDPAPFIRKVCECAPPDVSFNAQNTRDELGVSWSFCAAEGDNCQCPTGMIRFGKATRWVTSDQTGPTTSGPVPCEVESFSGADPAAGVPKECWCERGREQPPAPARVAIVLLSRRPPDLTLWLKYHVSYMGVDHVFMQVEDSPEFNGTWAKVASELRKHVTLYRVSTAERGAGNRPADDYTTLQSRQIKAMSRAKELAAEQGIHWLIHIDDDELLYTPMHRTIGELLAEMPDHFDQAYIPNTEAVYPSAEVQHCFEETTEINMNAYTFNSYANGKAAVRVADAQAVPAGPHMWSYADGHELPSIHLDREPFGPPLMVVHFESCPFARWEDKFWELGNTTASKVHAIPFRFYRESLQKMQVCRSGANVATPQAGQSCSDGDLKHFWAQYKTEENPALRRQDLMPLRIPWSKIAR